MNDSSADCKDCGRNTLIDPKDYYVVIPEIWNKFGLGGCKWTEDLKGYECNVKGMLCMGCLENRMGRKLRKEDIFVCGVTTSMNPYTSRILLQP